MFHWWWFDMSEEAGCGFESKSRWCLHSSFLDIVFVRDETCGGWSPTVPEMQFRKLKRFVALNLEFCSACVLFLLLLWNLWMWLYLIISVQSETSKGFEVGGSLWRDGAPMCTRVLCFLSPPEETRLYLRFSLDEQIVQQLLLFGLGQAIAALPLQPL